MAPAEMRSIRCYNAPTMPLSQPMNRHAEIARRFASRDFAAMVLCLIAMLLLAGCGAEPERLVPVRGTVPVNLDLSGNWRMQDDVNDMAERIDAAIRQTDGVDERDILDSIVTRRDQTRRRRSPRDVGGLVHVFLENGERLRITQTDAGLFIAFDRSVVEEYRFGEARMVRTGGAEAQRVSGWQGDAYVIETLDASGMKLTERYRLESGGERLIREIELRSAELENVAIVQTFRRS